MVNVRGLNPDGTYVQGVVRISESRQSLTVVQVFRGEYEDQGDRMKFIPEGGRAFDVQVERDGDEVLVNNVVQTRVSAWLHAALQSQNLGAR